MLIDNRYGYVFDPETMYQPEIDPSITHFDVGKHRIHRDGHVENLDEDWGLSHTKVCGWNVYEQAGTSFRAYQEIAKHFWPKRPRQLSAVDHINRVRSDDSWGNLRLCNKSLNNINQYRKGTKGYRHETSEWLQKVNAYRSSAGKKPLVLSGPPRNKYIAMLTYRGQSVELGEFDNPEDATACYLAAKEPFIQNELRRLWTEFLSAN